MSGKKSIVLFAHGGSGPLETAGPRDEVITEAGQVFSYNDWIRQMVADPERGETGRLVQVLRMAREYHEDGYEVTAILGSGMMDDAETFAKYPVQLPPEVRQAGGRTCIEDMMNFLYSPEVQAAFPDMNRKDVEALMAKINWREDVESANTQVEAQFALQVARETGARRIISISTPDHARCYTHLAEEGMRLKLADPTYRQPSLSFEGCQRVFRPERRMMLGQQQVFAIGNAGFEDQHQCRDNVKVIPGSGDPVHKGRASWAKVPAFAREAGNASFRQAIVDFTLACKGADGDKLLVVEQLMRRAGTMLSPEVLPELLRQLEAIEAFHTRNAMAGLGQDNRGGLNG